MRKLNEIIGFKGDFFSGKGKIRGATVHMSSTLSIILMCTNIYYIW